MDHFWVENYFSKCLKKVKVWGAAAMRDPATIRNFTVVFTLFD